MSRWVGTVAKWLVTTGAEGSKRNTSGSKVGTLFSSKPEKVKAVQVGPLTATSPHGNNLYLTYCLDSGLA